MDVIVTPSDDGTAWTLMDLLGRSMGAIEAVPTDKFLIRPHGQALETMAGIDKGPFPSLDRALAEIEKHTRGTCRRNAGEDAG